MEMKKTKKTAKKNLNEKCTKIFQSLHRDDLLCDKRLLENIGSFRFIRLIIKLCRVFYKQGKVTLQCKMPITDNRIWEDLEFPTIGYI